MDKALAFIQSMHGSIIAFPYVKNLALYPVIAILSMVPITIGGFGVREGFFVYFYGILGVSILNYSVLTLVPAMTGVCYI